MCGGEKTRSNTLTVLTNGGTAGIEPGSKDVTDDEMAFAVGALWTSTVIVARGHAVPILAGLHYISLTLQ